MPGLVRVYLDATVALAIMATLAVVAGFLAIAATGNRTSALVAAATAFVMAAAVAAYRLWQSTRQPVPPPDAAA